MKKINYYFSFIAILALFLTSCSKDEASDVTRPDVQETFQLQFGILLNDFNKQQQTKDHEAPPVQCRDDDPAYVKVGITDSDGFFVGDDNGDAVKDVVLLDVNIKNNGGSWETVFSDELGLPAGTYSLQYFIVYDADDEILWVAPRTGGAYASSVDSPLPKPIVLGAGTKPYIDVDVLCFIPREEEAFGYLFFDFELTEVINNYCIFVNYCYDETGREYPAKFMVEVWKNSKIPANSISLDPNMNSVSGEGNSFAATVLCMPLPPLVGQDVYIVRVTVLDAGVYDADAADFKEFIVTQADINAQLNEVPSYEHIRVNCDDDGGNGNGGNDCLTAEGDCDGDTIKNKCDDEDPNNVNFDTFDCDGDRVLNDTDECLRDGVRDNVDEVGCPLNGGGEECDTIFTCDIGEEAGSGCDFTFINGDASDEIFVKVNSDSGPFDLRNVLNDKFGELTTAFDGEGDLVVTIDNNVFNEPISKYEIEVHPADDDENMITTCQDMECNSNVTANTSSINVELTRDVVTKYPFYIRVKSTGCFSI